VRETLASLMRKQLSIPKSHKTPGFVDACVREHLLSGDRSATMDNIVLKDEDAYCQDGCPIYFPESTALCRMVYGAKVDVRPEDLSPFASAFSIAFPSDLELDGVKNFPGVLIRWCQHKDKLEENKRWAAKLGLTNYVVTGVDPKMHPDEWTLNMHYRRGNMMYHAMVSQSKMAACLVGADEFVKTLGTLSAPGVVTLTPDEREAEYIMFRLVMKLMVYVTACPTAVVPGWPDKVCGRDVGAGYVKVFKPQKMGMPAGWHEHDSPVPHWRTWHFRRYPVRPDGGRRAGVVFVSGCYVGWTVDPKTVLTVSG
jgi:hypothetical protein